jgi:Xaa-Pro aminopeptidase
VSDEFAARRRLVSAGLENRELDAMLLTSLANVRYLTGFTGSNAVMLVLPGEAIFFTDPRYAIQSGREVTCRRRVAKGPILAAVAAMAPNACGGWASSLRIYPTKPTINCAPTCR